MITEGSPQWQQYIFLVAGLLLLYNLWRGWRLGAVRGLLRLVALFCAWIGGSATAGVTGTVIAFFTKETPLLVPAMAGLLVGLGIYTVISLISGLLFKTTENHGGIVRFGFGFFGALFGIIYGLLFLWAGITLIRGMGACGELRIVQARNEGRALGNESMALALVKLKASLELGITGRSLSKADPLPTVFYDDIVKISMVAGNQQALERFFQYPKTLEVLKNPKVAAILRDPALEKASANHNILPLLRNKNVQAAAQDPHLLAMLKAFDLTAALDFALEQPEAPTANRKGKIPPLVSPYSPPAATRVKTAFPPISPAL